MSSWEEQHLNTHWFIGEPQTQRGTREVFNGQLRPQEQMILTQDEAFRESRFKVISGLLQEFKEGQDNNKNPSQQARSSTVII